ncbi:beta-ketoacyl synthase chain length factor [Pelomonas sp. KK5]|uniref:beta-ketoacyl synthase chain length factor n=1 Tax=Pelomonas sp. KK5 TaxID=1855730 RepID=UPI00097C448D|nr:beta-ketoacyl synthase chain length factor [Pelomonas sp. KK5]
MSVPSPLKLQIERWAAWAPGLATQADWLAWLADPVAPVPASEDRAPPLAEMPAMMRRRIEPLGRIALQAAYWAQGEQASTGPVVFASRWGEVARSVEMLQQLAAGEALSPTAFSLSVHNAIGALFSIARGDRGNYQAVAAGAHSVEAGFYEAAGLIAAGAERVLLVAFEAPLPAPYAELVDDNSEDFPRAFALMLTRAAGVGGISLQGAAPTTDAAVRADLAALRFLLGTAAEHRAGRWHWRRHHVA